MSTDASIRSSTISPMLDSASSLPAGDGTGISVNESAPHTTGLDNDPDPSRDAPQSLLHHTTFTSPAPSRPMSVAPISSTAHLPTILIALTALGLDAYALLPHPEPWDESHALAADTTIWSYLPAKIKARLIPSYPSSPHELWLSLQNLYDEDVSRIRRSWDDLTLRSPEDARAFVGRFLLVAEEVEEYRVDVQDVFRGSSLRWIDRPGWIFGRFVMEVGRWFPEFFRLSNERATLEIAVDNFLSVLGFWEAMEGEGQENWRAREDVEVKEDEGEEEVDAEYEMDEEQ